MSNARELAELGGSYGQGGFVGMKNRIINGAMVIDQRNAGASVTIATSGTYTLDRWVGWASPTSKYSVQQNAGSVTPPAGFINYLGVTSLSAYSIGAGELETINQPIEGLNIADLAWGTASAATVTLSFWVRSSLTGTFGGALQNSAQNRSYPFSYTISSANTWEQKSITIAGDTSGTWLTTNSVGIRLHIGLGVGSTYSGTAGSWAGSNYLSSTGATSVVGTNGATFYITGVQLEKGSTATSFDYRPYSTELALCQRYCRYDDMRGMVFGNLIPAGTDEFYLSRSIPNMRVAPTCTFPDGYPTSLQRGGITLVGSTVTNQSTENSINLHFDTGTSQTVGNYYVSTVSSGYRLISSSEL